MRIFVKNKRYIIFTILCLLAFTIHKSAILGLALIPLYYISYKFKHFDIVEYCGAVIAPILAPLAFAFLRFINLYTGYLSLNYTFDFFFIICLLPPVIVYYLSLVDDFDCRLLLNIYVISFVCQTFGFAAEFVDRLTYYFYIFLVIFIPSVIEKIKDEKERKGYTRWLYLWFIVYYLVVFCFANTADAYPYFK